MTHGIVRSKTGVTLVGGGAPRVKDIVNSVATAPCLIAADGGANFCLDAGLSPKAVIGDFDSIHDETRAALGNARMIEYADQDLTDFEKCLRVIDAPFVLGVGFSEGRLDHTMAVMAVLSRRIWPPTIILGTEDIAFAAPRALKLELTPGTRVSLFPMVATRGRSKGLRWPIDGLTLDPKGRLGTSNEATGPVHLSFEEPGCIVLIPRAHLPQALAALTD